MYASCFDIGALVVILLLEAGYSGVERPTASEEMSRKKVLILNSRGSIGVLGSLCVQRVSGIDRFRICSLCGPVVVYDRRSQWDKILNTLSRLWGINWISSFLSPLKMSASKNWSDEKRCWRSSSRSPEGALKTVHRVFKAFATGSYHYSSRVQRQIWQGEHSFRGCNWARAFSGPGAWPPACTPPGGYLRAGRTPGAAQCPVQGSPHARVYHVVLLLSRRANDCVGWAMSCSAHP